MTGLVLPLLRDAEGAGPLRPRTPPRRARVRAMNMLAMRVRPDDQHSDAELARAIAGPDHTEARSAEATLCKRFARRVFFYGLRHLGDEQRAADLVQDVMAAVIRRLRANEVREPDRIGSFVLGTARMLARDARRGERRREALADQVAAQTETISQPREPLDVARLEECLKRLTERDRSIVLLTFMAEQPATEIGTTFGLSPGNVRVIRHRAVRSLQRCMDPGDES
jgi:RNA polymerase sigma-70 factor, ECF subfamily